MPVAPLARLPSGSDVFLDANVFVNALLGQSVECLELLQRCTREDVYGATTLHVINEATHRLMLAEACAAGIIAKQHPSLLGKRLQAITTLSKYWIQTQTILTMNMAILPVEEACLYGAHSVRSSYGMLTNDSLIVAAMRDYGLSIVASADGDFDHIMGLTRYTPTDLPRSS